MLVLDGSGENLPGKACLGLGFRVRGFGSGFCSWGYEFFIGPC